MKKTWTLRSLSSKKIPRYHRKKLTQKKPPPQKKKTAATKKAAAQAESEDAKAQAEEENAAAAGANCENAEAKTEEVERMCTGSMMNDSVETANEAGGRHRGRPVQDHLVFHNDHVEHGVNDSPDENEKTEAESKGIESTSTETTPYVVETAGVQGEEHSDRSTVNDEADRTVGDDHHARCIHPDIEAGSIVLQVSNNMSEGKKGGEEASETTTAKETEEISKKRRGNWKTH